jgi:hypothetical protein
MSGRNRGYCAHLYERPEIKQQFHDPDCPNPFELCLQAFREGIGNDRILLACQGHSSGPEAQYADASRLGADIVHPNQPVMWANVQNQGKCFINQAFTHNITMIADPDTLLVRDLPLEEARVTATIVALPGQLTFFGDKLDGLPPERMKILQQTLPVASVRPANLYPSFTMLPVWNLAVHHQQLGNYNVIALFNWENEPQTIEVAASELGIDHKTPGTAYEFWTHAAISLKSAAPAQISMHLPARSVRIIVLHPLKNHPQWIGSDRHIAQTGMEITRFRWENHSNTIQGTIQLVGNFPLTMRIRTPEGCTCQQITCSNAKCTALQETPDVLAITFHAEQSAEYPFQIKFNSK